MKPAMLLACYTALALGACSGASGVTTSSVSTQAAAPVFDATSRAMQVGTTSARAVKCGYNFDPAKLKTNFLAAESKINPADSAKAEQVYTVAFNGVSKGVAAKADYCTPQKTTEIKEALTRHLAGDFNPPPPKVEMAEPGFFDKLGDGNGSGKDGNFGKDDWWDQQAETKKGGR